MASVGQAASAARGLYSGGAGAGAMAAYRGMMEEAELQATRERMQWP